MLIKPFLQHILFGHVTHNHVLKVMHRAAKELNLPIQPLLRDFQAETKRISKKQASIAVDAPSRGHLEFCSALLAAYRQLRPIFDNDKEKTIAYLENKIFTSFNTPLLRGMLKLLLFSCRNNPERLRNIFSWLMNQYGSTFAWSAPHSGGANNCHFQVSIQRCFYVEFFKAHELRELTTVLCKIDSLWYEMIDAKTHGFIFNRTGYQTQGFGAKTCEFPIKQIKVVNQNGY